MPKSGTPVPVNFRLAEHLPVIADEKRIPLRQLWIRKMRTGSDSGTLGYHLCDSEGRDVDMNCRRFRHVSLFILIFSLATPRLLADSVDDYVREQMTARHIPGLVLLVLNGGKVIKQQSYGLANVELGVPTTKDSAFPLASVTKVFTATAVYLLVQEGKLHLDEKARISCRNSQMLGAKLLS